MNGVPIATVIAAPFPRRPTPFARYRHDRADMIHRRPFYLVRQILIMRRWPARSGPMHNGRGSGLL